MQKINFSTGRITGKWFIILFVLLTGVFLQTNAQAFTLNVQDADGNLINDLGVSYRYLVEEDVTYPVDPAAPENDEDTLALNFHKSYMPVVAKGGASSSVVINLPNNKRYFVSVLPFPGGYTMGGAPVAVGQTEVIVTLNKHPVPTAQISVFVFEDIAPINNAPDLPTEQGLEGFDIKIFDAGGRYGIVGGQQFTDVFGNPLGTTYNPDDSVLALGSGTILTDAAGLALIKNLAPGKYGVVVTPPAGQGWQQTSTIEGSTTIDAWVKANEPPFFTEFGPPGQHVFVGFIKEFTDAEVLTGGATLQGRVVNNHLSRPPDYSLYPGQPLPDTWIGLNDLAVGIGRGVYAAPANGDSTFSIPDVPPGTYELVTWDRSLNLVMSLRQVNVTGPATIDLGDVPAFGWFGHLQGSVFYDTNANGFRDAGEMGLWKQAVLLRFRDGTVYDATATDFSGAYSFTKVFPFFSWLVAEVDFLDFTATGATVVVDAGGEVRSDAGWDDPTFDRLNPQLQDQVNPNTTNNKSWTEATSPGDDLLTLGIQTFLGQTNVIDWGKRDYDPASDPFPNGGISGIVFYDTTRAENDPEGNFGEEWQPGIPRIQVNLYRDCNGDGIIDVPLPTSSACSILGSENPDTFTLADVDNYPFGWSDGGVKGAEDFDRNNNGNFDKGDAIQVAYTDSWDDAKPTDCPGDPDDPFYFDGKCYDGLRNFNQVRPAVFDGGYAFAELDPGTYIVEVGQHPVYDVVRAEDKNVDFGDEFTPGELLQTPACVGEPYVVPQYLNLFPGVLHPFYDPESPPTVFRQEFTDTPPLMLSHCDRKQVSVEEGANTAAEFFLYTDVPPTARIKGFILNDLANEFDPLNPNFGEKFAPPLLPISFRDWTGKEITRVYSDQFGNYNLLVPSTYTANVPNASGFSPAMLIGCMNDPGPIPDGSGGMIIDPYFQRQYSQFCYTFQYMPGAITYLDTPVLPIAAFASQTQFPLDCEFADGTPVIYSVMRNNGNGPYINMDDGNRRLRIVSAGDTSVDNPAFGAAGQSKTVTRDFGFGNTQAGGTVTIDDIPLEIVSWSSGLIVADVPTLTDLGKYQLMVTRGDNGLTSAMGVSVVIGNNAGPNVVPVIPDPNPAATPIQDAIDLAQPGDLILVPPGGYAELVILWKDVQLQGAGAPSTIINAVQFPGEKLLAWRQKAEDLVSTGEVDLLPGQEVVFGGLEPPALFTEEGAGILVMASDPDGGSQNNVFGADPRPRIDGLTVTGSNRGGGMVLNGYASNLEISNNRVTGNHGVYGGGLRSGHPFINNNIVDAENNDLLIHHNRFNQNGATSGVGAGAGISLYTGSDRYEVTDNFICGNFSTGDGGGIGHLGESPDGLIARNKVLFNQSFNQGLSVSGGGIFIGGAPDPAGGLTAGSGSVVIDSNLIQGNQAGAGDGGGIRLALINGLDIPTDELPPKPDDWYTIKIVNNMIVNNMAGLAAGGISMQDAARPRIIHNTIAHNDSTATAGLAFENVNGATSNISTPQPAGVVSRAHSLNLANRIAGLGTTGPAYMGFSNPELVNNIIWLNRSFYFDINLDTGVGTIQPAGGPTTWVFDDLAVLPDGTGTLNPLSCILTDTASTDGSNISANPVFVHEYFNTELGTIFGQPEGTTAFDVAAALDEGGNFIDVAYSPLTLYDDPTSPDGLPGTLFGDYHITPASPAKNVGDPAPFSPATVDDLLDFDIDDDPRPLPATVVDIGADELDGEVVPGGFDCLYGSLDPDSDVDGLDLAAFDPALIDLATFAQDFGKTDCATTP